MKLPAILCAVICSFLIHGVVNGQEDKRSGKAAKANRAPNYEKYAVLDKLVGEWDTYAISAGVKTEGKFRCRWAPGRHCIIWSLTLWEADKPKKTLERMDGVNGWNAAENCLIEQIHTSNGSYLLTRWRIDGDGMIGDRHGADAEGRKLKTQKPVQLDFVGDEIRLDSLRYLTEDGEVVADFTDIVWRRAKK